MSLRELKVKGKEIMWKRSLSKFPADSKAKREVSLEMSCSSGFASLGRGAILRQIQDELHKALVGVGWDHTEGTIPCAYSKLGEILLRRLRRRRRRASGAERAV